MTRALDCIYLKHADGEKLICYNNLSYREAYDLLTLWSVGYIIK